MEPDKQPSCLDDRLKDTSFEVFQEKTAQDVADKVRFLYQELKLRTAVRDRAVESLLWQECEIDTRLDQVIRAYGWFNEVGEKERVQLRQELRNVEKERRDLYESTFNDLHKIKLDLVDALLEYRSLRRRGTLLGDVTERLSAPSQYALPLLSQYLAPAAPPDSQPAEPTHVPPYDRRMP